MKTRWQVLIGVLLLFMFIYATKGVLLPFVAGLAVAYLLDPLADRLEAWKFPRWLAAATILFIFFVGVSGIIVGMMPIVQDQIFGIAESLPRYIASLRPIIDSFLARVNESFNVATDAEGITAAIAEEGLSRLGAMVTGVISGGAALFNLLTLLLISPVVAFFLLRDWDLLIAKLGDWLPSKQEPVIRLLAGRIDTALAGFVRGQTLVSLTMAVLYAVGWSLVGLEYGLILGLIAGVMAYVPFVGALFAAVIAMLVGFGQFGADFAHLAPIFGVFVVVQIIEAAFLTPRLIGSRVGLHPVWVLFAIFAGGEMMGFVGMLIALPAAAAIGVVVRHLIEQYLDSDLRDHTPEPEVEPEVEPQSEVSPATSGAD